MVSRFDMRFINDIHTATIGESWTNEKLLRVYEQAVGRLDLDDEARDKLLAFVRFQLVGKRSRHIVPPDFANLSDFRSRAQAFEAGAELALDQLAVQVAEGAAAAGI